MKKETTEPVFKQMFLCRITKEQREQVVRKAAEMTWRRACFFVFYLIQRVGAYLEAWFVTAEEGSSQRTVRLFIYLLIFKDLLSVCHPLGTVLSIRGTKNNECHGLRPKRGDHLEGKRQEQQRLRDRAG